MRGTNHGSMAGLPPTGKAVELRGADFLTFSITSLQVLDEDTAQRVREASRQSLAEMLQMDGFIGATNAKIGNRMVTISAWRDAESSRFVIRGGTHAEAMCEMLAGKLASAGFTSVWALDHDNGYMVRCTKCGVMARKVQDGDCCKCGAELPLHPPYR